MRLPTFFAKLALMVVLVAATLQLAFIQARKLETPYYEDSTYAWVNHLSVKPEIVILGSSTARYNLSPGEMTARLGLKGGAIVNLGANQCGSAEMYHFWNTIKPAQDSVKIVLMTVDPWIGYQSYDRIEGFPTLYWSPWQRIYTAFDDRYRKYVLAGSFVLDVFNQSAPQLFHDPIFSLEIPEDYGGEVIQRHYKNFSEHTREYFGQTSVYPISEFYLSHLVALKRSVEADGAIFMLVLPPKQSAWLRGYKTSCRSIDSDYVSHLNSLLGPTRVIGSFGLFASPGDDTLLFMDHDHLSREGRRRFTDSVSANLKAAVEVGPALLKSLYSY